MRMMDQGRTDQELREIFAEIQQSYEALLKDGFVLQEEAFEFARRLLRSSAETRSRSNRETLDALIERSRSQQEALGNLVKLSASAFTTVLDTPYAHDHKVEQVKAVLVEASTEAEEG
jgi:hypothetical protein